MTNAFEQADLRGHSEHLYACRRSVDMAVGNLNQIIANLELDSRFDQVARDEVLDHLRAAVRSSQSASSALFLEHARLGQYFAEPEGSS